MPGKKGRKIGRNKEFGKKYIQEGREEKNKLKKRVRHLKDHPTDLQNGQPAKYFTKKLDKH